MKFIVRVDGQTLWEPIEAKDAGDAVVQVQEEMDLHPASIVEAYTEDEIQFLDNDD